MKKFLIFGAVVLVAILALGVAGYAYAQVQTPPTPYNGTTTQGGQAISPMMGGQGRGMMGASGQGFGRGNGRGMMGGGYGMMAGGQYGPIHDYMISALAGKLGLTVDELNTRIANGETPYSIAQAQGKTAEEIATLFNEAHDEALQAAVDAGAITQAQADWMDQHHESMWANGVPGSMPCQNGRWNAAPAQAPTN